LNHPIVESTKLLEEEFAPKCVLCSYEPIDYTKGYLLCHESCKCSVLCKHCLEFHNKDFDNEECSNTNPDNYPKFVGVDPLRTDYILNNTSGDIKSVDTRNATKYTAMREIYAKAFKKGVNKSVMEQK
jgi:hypothetical protein